jgi:asparaginyl-tRNA synthetase
MNTFTPISTLKDCIGQEVTLAGWVYKNRPTGKLIFLTVRDGTGLCQCIIEKGEATADFFADAKHLAQESSVTVRGTVRGDERAVGGCELVVSGIELVHAARDYPITPKAHGVEFLMKHRHLWFRSRRQFLILRIRATVVDAIRSYFNRNGYVLIDTPLFAPSAGEGESTLFEVDYFGEPVSLAQTGQLYVESACMAHGKVYCFGPTFRAEKSKTRRHLTEFWMVEPEIAFADLDEVIAMAEDFVCDVVGRVLRDHRADLEELGRDLGRARSHSETVSPVALFEGGGTAPRPAGSRPARGRTGRKGSPHRGARERPFPSWRRRPNPLPSNGRKTKPPNKSSLPARN